MQSAAISISPSIVFSKPRLNPNFHNHNLNLSFNSLPIRPCLSSSSRRLSVVNGASNDDRNNCLNRHQLSKSRFDGLISLPSVKFSGAKKLAAKDGFVARATSVPESADSGDVAPKAISGTLELGILFGLWYLFNIYFNIYNKQVLKVFHYPMTVTLIQFAGGSVLVILMWLFNLYKKPKVTAAQLASIVPLAIVHTLGNLFTNMSLGKVAVSFTHTIKAMEPFFSVLLSVAFLGEKPTFWVVLALLPIVGGVALASVTEASFNWSGFWSAMASNLTNQSRNVLSKKVMVKTKEAEPIDNITLFSIITLMSFVLLAPFTVFMEGVKFTPTYMEAAGLNVQQVYMRSLLAALCFHAYQQVSYMILQRVSPVTHSVGNCVKRVVVITSSVIFFKTPVSPINAMGTAVALAGVFLYSRVKSIKPKPKAA